MSNLQTRLQSDTWIAASWEEYSRTIEDPLYEKAKGYYYKGHLRIEMLPVSFDHGRDHTTIILAVNLFTVIKGIPATGLDTTTLRKVGVRECQPDVSYYIGDRSQVVPAGTGIIDLDRYLPPNLVIEVAKTSLLDDIGTKRALYEELGVSEYWVIDVQNTQIIAYVMSEGGSKPIRVSQVLPGLTIEVLEDALRRSRETNQSQVGAGLLTQFQA